MSIASTKRGPTVLVISDVNELQERLAAERKAGESVCLVPTMGNLHKGHLALVEEARRVCGRVVVSVFVNPMQFGPAEDFERYPRSLDEDLALLEQQGCDFVFTPSVEAIYGEGAGDGGDAESIPLRRTSVRVPGLGDEFCGKSRPGHFNGVTTVVNILFNLVRPDKAVFGLKDYQQFLLVRRMVRDLRMDIDIIGVETRREANGLAMSSRNNYLSAAEQEQATALYRCLCECWDALVSGARGRAAGNVRADGSARADVSAYTALEEAAKADLIKAGLRPDYFAIRAADTLQPPTIADRRLAILGAVYLGDTHLIDNLRLELP